jgi:hypothetical protein
MLPFFAQDKTVNLSVVLQTLLDMVFGDKQTTKSKMSSSHMAEFHSVQPPSGHICHCGPWQLSFPAKTIENVGARD